MKSISKKVILVFILFILPLNLMVISQSKFIMTSAVEQVVSAEQNLIDFYAQMLEEKMNNSSSFLHYFHMENADCLNMVIQKDGKSYKYQGAKYKLYSAMKKMAEMIDGAENYFYYFPLVNDILVLSDPYVGIEYIKELKKAISDGNSFASMKGWHIIENKEGRWAFLYVKLKNISYGTWIDLDKLAANILAETKYNHADLSFSEGTIENKEKKDIIFISGKAKNLHINLELEKTEIMRADVIYQRMMLNIAILYLILVPVLFWVIRTILIKPLCKINDAHRQLENGNLDYRLDERAKSKEFAIAYKSFNKMVSAIKELRIQTYEDKIEKQKMELRNLQLQIRPHFLLNTFNLVYSLAEERKTETIQNILIYLSEYFRCIFRNEKELELFPKELRLITGYIYMVSIRYENLVELSVDLDPEISFVRTPPLLIHNFIENAVKYGFRQGRPLLISLEGRYNDGWVVFQIMDDGNGMESKMLEINQRMFRGEWVPEDKNKHLGLYNSYKRLKYFYGDEASIEVESELGAMSCFTISFPYDLEVDDESFDIE